MGTNIFYLCGGRPAITKILMRTLPVLWSLGQQMDQEVLRLLLEGKTIGDAVYEARRRLLDTNILALVYSVFGDGHARLVSQTPELLETEPARPRLAAGS